MKPIVVQSLWRGKVHRMPFMREIAEEVCEKWGIDVSDLLSMSRVRRIAWPRQEFMWECRQIKYADGGYRFSLFVIGQFLGGMDHTTVIHGVRAHEQRRHYLVDDRICHTADQAEAA